MSRAALVVVAVVTFGFQPQPAPDLLLVNGKIFQGSASGPWAQALAIRDTRIVAVGTTATIRALADAHTRTLDLGGRLLIPGINDAHTHVGARPPGVTLALTGDDPTLEEVVAAIKAALPTAKESDWIYGTVGERVLSDPKATRATLDDAAAGRIVKLSAWTGHGSILSSAALKALGIGDREADPPFGRYGRTPDGIVNGLLEEYADIRAGRAMAKLAGRFAIVDSLRRLATEAHGYGVTTIQAMANSVPAGELVSMLRDSATGIRWRVIRFPVALDESQDRESYAELPRQSSPHVTITGVKWILDGTPIERLSAMNAPYADKPGWSGRVNLSPEDIAQVLRRSIEAGEPVLLHVTGDRTIDAVLSTMERMAEPAVWQRARVRFEHGEFVSGPRLARARQLGVVVVQNPAHFTIPHVIGPRFGAERAGEAQMVKAIVQAGMPLALGGDGPLNPFLNMMFALQHPVNPSQALTREQVLIAYTTGSAFAEFTERDKGRIAPGMLADVAALNQDIFTVPLDRLPATQSVLTIVDGKTLRVSLGPQRTGGIDDGGAPGGHGVGDRGDRE